MQCSAARPSADLKAAFDGQVAPYTGHLAAELSKLNGALSADGAGVWERRLLWPRAFFGARVDGGVGLSLFGHSNRVVRVRVGQGV